MNVDNSECVTESKHLAREREADHNDNVTALARVQDHPPHVAPPQCTSAQDGSATAMDGMPRPTKPTKNGTGGEDARRACIHPVLN